MLTPYYHEKPEVYEGLDDTRQFNPYHLFCLLKRLHPLLRSLGLSGRTITTPGVVIDNRRYLRIDVGEVTEQQQEQIQQLIDKHAYETSTYAIYFTSELLVDGRSVPADWLKEVIPKIAISQVYQPEIDQHGLLVDVGGYNRYEIEPRAEGSYKERYNDLVVEIYQVIREHYRKGHLAELDPQLAAKWGYSYHDGWWRPQWTNLMLIECYSKDLVQFIRSRQRGRNTVMVRLRTEHWSMAPNRIGDIGFFPVDNLTQLRELIASLTNYPLQ